MRCLVARNKNEIPLNAALNRLSHRVTPVVVSGSNAAGELLPGVAQPRLHTVSAPMRRLVSRSSKSCDDAAPRGIPRPPLPAGGRRHGAFNKGLIGKQCRICPSASADVPTPFSPKLPKLQSAVRSHGILATDVMLSGRACQARWANDAD